MLLVGAMMAMNDGVTDPSATESAATIAALREAEIAAYSGGSYAEATAMRLRYFVNALGFNAFLVPLVLGMFLIGGWLVRSGALDRNGVVSGRGWDVRVDMGGGSTIKKTKT